MLPQFHITVADPQNKEGYKLVVSEKQRGAYSVQRIGVGNNCGKKYKC